ncbi:chromosome partitioning protein [Amycolatopsis sp. CA-128772]|uniref:chromosome partitioning protein n=1 Tax=Amycolatopsis sp. CA-128772 TaxID=2073159 RepID=UPI0011AFEB07|nr:chromosome partitioning protein [Amycolatopsis sp. CA-128772]
MGIEVVLVALVAWAVGKARRAGKQLDGVVDEVIDAGAARARDKVRDVVLGKLESDSAVQKLKSEVVETGQVSERTRRRVVDAVENAAEEDERFAAQLRAVIDEAQKHPTLMVLHNETAVSGTATASGQGTIAIGAVGRDANVQQPPDPQRPGRV